MRNFNSTFSSYRAKYPLGGKTSNAFAALYDEKGNGIYIGLHDPEGNFKEICIVGAKQTDSSFITANCTAPYEGKAGNSFTLPGKIVYESFSGDWF